MATIFSPLRYPGGKSAIAPYLAALLRANNYSGRVFAEPFAGGAGAAVKLLYAAEAEHLALNDVDQAICDLWLAILGETEEFLKLLRDTPVTVEEWSKQRAIWEKPEHHELAARGFATFFLNRTNRSGILRGRPIGGLDQSGAYPITARYNKANLEKRILRLAKWKSRISISCLDALDFIEALAALPRPPFLFLDPPYVGQGRHLYMNAFGHEQHESLATWLRAHSRIPWVLTYDDHPIIHELYSWAHITQIPIRYSAQTKRKATELLILPPWVTVPTEEARPLCYS
ncbi:DNA adenine methylase [Oceanidesulfovibrio marinus]|uniref:DNA adenine methylase n=1 Tax=Oceanidesulfovibrio marinus TaxID=370038 RepID=A0ABX6NHV1_9BACT|nr:DNA adenine methylase [Oceanidesulfovibrio marinus]QJT10215.1 DNA adenine methylase [Oceanidesulfovibrio marinus]